MSDPPRYPPTSTPRPPTSASVQPNGVPDVTWLEFLRTAGNTIPAEGGDQRSSSSDRKRRHTGSEPERRGYPWPTHVAAASSTVRRASGLSGRSPEGMSREFPVDLVTPERRRSELPRRMSPGHGHIRGGGQSGSTRRRDSEMALPKWQPDAEVDRCPVCKTEFSFWHRKHHCRKCGRVVCNACSPHRITIPRQYIVQPPNPFEAEFGIHGSESPGSRALGGGAVVRVCNPCVPDPWTPDNGPRGGEGGDVPSRPLIEGVRGVVDTTSPDRPEPYRYNPPTSAFNNIRNRSHSHQPVTAHSSRSTPAQDIHPDNSSAFASSRRPTLPPPTSTRHRHSQSSTAPFPRPIIGSSLSTINPPRRQPSREIREEDECPVCGTELPPGEALREAHIQNCITTRFTPSSMSTPPPPTTAGNRPRTTSYKSRGMALFRATEKDCQKPDGGREECLFCMEDFEVGDELGRMECLCKFHRHCIKEWWKRKGAGSCPTHQLHE